MTDAAETMDAIDRWLTDGLVGSDRSPDSYRSYQQQAYRLFFRLGSHIVHKANGTDGVTYAPLDVEERTVTRQPGSDSEKLRVAIGLSSRVIGSVITPRVTAYEIEPGQAFDPLNFDPDAHTAIRTLDLPNGTPWLHPNPDWPQLEGRPTMEDVTNVALFEGILNALGSITAAKLDTVARRAIY